MRLGPKDKIDMRSHIGYMRTGEMVVSGSEICRIVIVNLIINMFIGTNIHVVMSVFHRSCMRIGHLVQDISCTQLTSGIDTLSRVVYFDFQ